MELVTSGLHAMPERLTPKAIFELSFHEYDKVKDQLYIVQVIAVRKFDNNLKRTSGQGLSLEISDGVGSAPLIVNREIFSEIELSKMHITENSILVMRGRISR